MVRWLVRGVLALVLVGAVLESAGLGQPAGAQDRIYYREKKDRDGSPKFVEGEIKLTPAGYQIVTGGKSIPVSPLEIVRVIPNDPPGIDAKDLSAVGQAEIAKEWENARVGYTELRKKAGAPPEKVRKFLDFKVATMTARAADVTPEDAGWKEKATAAATLLTQYLADHKTGWEVYPAGRTSARLQTELGEHENAARLWAKLAASPEVPADLKQEALIQEVDSFIRAKRYPDAANRAADGLKTATAGAAKDRLTICQIVAKNAETDPIQGVAPIEAEIAKTKDPLTRATGYAMLGELYLAANKPREAMWMELWVEVVYNQDRDEVTKALCRLAECFQAQGDEERAKATREKLRRHRASL